MTFPSWSSKFRGLTSRGFQQRKITAFQADNKLIVVIVIIIVIAIVIIIITIILVLSLL